MKKVINSTIYTSDSVQKMYRKFFMLNPAAILGGICGTPEVNFTILKMKSAKIGKEKLIFFNDGSTAIYYFLSTNKDVSFSVHMNEFSSSHFEFLDAMLCHYNFFRLDSGCTKIELCLEFKIKSGFWMVVFYLMFYRKLQGRLDNILDKQF
ncbi:MAG: hypothetical protein J7574_14205 [Flavobacterium sp.]|uniref:hypothetical protein n=1 Tax=Flavobacterium sp. TaxID=239 RepID=UPI001B016287|nr:hypothetical protein [Flavobacterium sp.]MBO9585312.1 hypothetical protein [Flavobacterium sp.]